jgi:hypothetical protein
MLGGDFYGISSDDPYWFSGHTVSANNLMSQLEGAGKTWKGYFQGMPYPGYRDYCYPNKCNGIPDADTIYVAKHNGIVNFANMQNATEFGKMYPLGQLAADLNANAVPSFSYIVGDECHDMHGAPPWCVDSGSTTSQQQSWLIAQGDKFVGSVVNQITSSSMWPTGNNAIVVTFDEGNKANSLIYSVVISNHGVRGVTDKTSYNHYSLLASLQQTFGLGCLLNSCTANPMSKLFAITGTNTVPTLPAPYNFPTSTDTISAQGAGKAAAAFAPSGSGWQLVPSFSYGSQDNDLAGVSAASGTDAWAVGAYYPNIGSVLQTLAHHWDGSRWTAYPLPNVGAQENVLLSVSMPATGKAWAAGYYVNGRFQQQTLVEHFDGTQWSVVSSPSPGALQNILYGIAAISDSDVWAVGAEEDANGLWHPLAEHWNGTVWSEVNAVDAGTSGNQLYAVKANATNDVYAVGQQANGAFPDQALVEHWNGSSWSVVTPPSTTNSLLPLGVTAVGTSLTIVGQDESDSVPYTTLVVSGTPTSLAIQATPDSGSAENDLFAAAINATDSSTWAVGWDIDTTTGNHDPLVLQNTDGIWSLISTPPLASGSDSGFAAVAPIPGGGMWAVGVTGSAKGNYSTLIEYHP